MVHIVPVHFALTQKLVPTQDLPSLVHPHQPTREPHKTLPLAFCLAPVNPIQLSILGPTVVVPPRECSYLSPYVRNGRTSSNELSHQHVSHLSLSKRRHLSIVHVSLHSTTCCAPHCRCQRTNDSLVFYSFASLCFILYATRSCSVNASCGSTQFFEWCGCAHNRPDHVTRTPKTRVAKSPVVPESPHTNQRYRRITLRDHAIGFHGDKLLHTK